MPSLTETLLNLLTHTHTDTEGKENIHTSSSFLNFCQTNLPHNTRLDLFVSCESALNIWRNVILNTVVSIESIARFDPSFRLVLLLVFSHFV